MDAETDRQLVAIMFTDIVGYTALMQADEQKAVKQRAKHRAVFQEEHARFNGRILQYYGDGTLSVFSSAVRASECAIKIQRRLRAGDPVNLRIGLHVGDIVFDDTEVYGDAVNIASRIESIATGGSVLLSYEVNQQLKNKQSINTTSLGYFTFKNIGQPIEVFGIVHNDLVVSEPVGRHLKEKSTHKSIAVLPFVDMSVEADNEYFSDGITEEIITALSKIESLKVTSRTSSFYFKNKSLPVAEIAKALGVSAILEGSVRVSGDTLRITAQLIQVEEDYHFWSARWDRKMENIFELQDEISLLIADKFREQFGHFEINNKLVDRQTFSVTAYDLLLRGRHLRNRWNPTEIEEAIELFERVIAIDPEYAEAYLELAECYSFLGTSGFIPYERGWQKAQDFTRLAREINEDLAGVHYQLGNAAFFIEGNYEKSVAEIKKALAAAPNNSEAHEFLSFLYIIAGDRKQSRKHLDAALTIDPLSEQTQFFNAYYYYMIEDFERADTLLERCLRANDRNVPAHSIRAISLLCQERYDEALKYHDSIPQEVVIPEERSGIRLLAHTGKGSFTEASEYLTNLKEQSTGHNALTADSFLFFHHVVTGDTDLAFAWLEAALHRQSYIVPIRLCDPLVSTLRGDPRYARMKRSIFATKDRTQNKRGRKVVMTAKAADSALVKLLEHLRINQPYLDPNLSLRTLAEQIGLYPNHLSWLINKRLHKSFNDLINQYRIETFKSLAENPINAGITLMGLAYDSGFNSKTTFNTSFKKHVGVSPRQFLGR